MDLQGPIANKPLEKPIDPSEELLYPCAHQTPSPSDTGSSALIRWAPEEIVASWWIGSQGWPKWSPNPTSSTHSTILLSVQLHCAVCWNGPQLAFFPLWNRESSMTEEKKMPDHNFGISLKSWVSRQKKTDCNEKYNAHSFAHYNLLI